MSKKVCKFCGEKIDKDDIFCKGCGAEIQKDEEIIDAIIEKDKTSKKDTNYLLFIIVVLLLIIAIVSGFLILFKN